MTPMNHTTTSNLIGTLPQQRWAMQIRGSFLAMAGGDVSLLPNIESSRFWIDARGARTLAELHEAARAFRDGYVFTSPFTSVFPRYGKRDAVLLLQSLGHFMVLDLETDGVGKAAQILEVAIVDHQGTPLLNSLVRPPNFKRLKSRETEKARETHGITATQLLDAPMLSDIWEDLIAVITEPDNGILMSFNTSFDLPVIRTCAHRENLLVPAISSLCAMKLATAYFERDFFLSLDEAGALAGLSRTDQETSHRALGDCLYTVRLIQALRQMAKEG